MNIINNNSVHQQNSDAHEHNKKGGCCCSGDNTPEDCPKREPGGEGGCGKCCGNSGGCGGCRHKLQTYDWLKDFPEMKDATNMVEVQFKNTRRDYFINSNDIDLFQGDMVAVEAFPGHDIGTVNLTGKLVLLQMKKNRFRPSPQGIRRIYRIAKDTDLEKYEEARAKEQETMIRAREIAQFLNLQMKIGDVEFQGDGNKAIFYYIAEGRVDFRELIKRFASEFRVKIEMKQIGARQEAGRIGGIGPCGRELCCSGWMSSFVSVSTTAARYQDISINPQKLAGQCGKLKCCINFEVDAYVEAQKKLPSREVVLETEESPYFHFKTDVFAGMMTYSTEKYNPKNLISIPRERVFEIISMNKRGEKPDKLNIEKEEVKPETPSYSSDLLQGQLNRFDKKKKKRGPTPTEQSTREGKPVIKKRRDLDKTASSEVTPNKEERTEVPVSKRVHKGQSSNKEGRQPNRQDKRPTSQQQEQYKGRPAKPDQQRGHSTRDRELTKGGKEENPENGSTSLGEAEKKKNLNRSFKHKRKPTRNNDEAANS